MQGDLQGNQQGETYDELQIDPLDKLHANLQNDLYCDFREPIRH